ncbi:small integral membrane protein 14 [Wyeomyia smithii]|uniref:small integral membrane protein 14 n=1 Tax=Wyeomyia smithii TaxID=174621 RepID=UPI002467E78B|nr:small integral membrane protein 14 [Wyeomyia smithii]XP_055530096.1 small integral membrane protein 14 [Wyeomyia smithii]XP_055530097.1 small integral membrane protein 14 [Wyeomyia smithii]XP_055530098.1 small integral membrane protein 14 [Wyeomyia smithii]
MSDEFDGCECIWSHELAMRRLLSLLRNGQSHCTETDCNIDLPNLPNQGVSDNFFMMMLFMIFAVILYMMRPASLRRRNDLNKALPPPSNDGPNNGGAPPAVN